MRKVKTACQQPAQTSRVYKYKQKKKDINQKQPPDAGASYQDNFRRHGEGAASDKTLGDWAKTSQPFERPPTHWKDLRRTADSRPLASKTSTSRSRTPGSLLAAPVAHFGGQHGLERTCKPATCRRGGSVLEQPFTVSMYMSKPAPGALTGGID